MPKGLSLAKIGVYEGAGKYFDKAIKLNPNNLLALISKANALIELGNEEEAKACYRQQANQSLIIHHYTNY